MKFRIELGEKSYDILILRGALSHIDDFIDLNRKVMLVTDDGVPLEYVDIVMSKFPKGNLFTVPQGEGAKSFAIFEKLCGELLKNGFSRNDLIVALGGGVVGDLAGYAAASYMRGIDFVNIPTTVLSQIDSSIGGKTAINLNGVKNIIGAFYQPKFVLIDSDTLKTLPMRHFNNGLAEAVKAGLIGDEKLFSLFEQGKIVYHIDEIILRSLQVKKKIVELDEKEQGLRKILNFGHTIGHAVESVYGLSGLLHGEAVAVGMLPMIEDEKLKKRTYRVFEKLSINPYMPYDVKKVYEIMTRDKKTYGKKITVVKVKTCGSAELCEIPIEKLRSFLKGDIVK